MSGDDKKRLVNYGINSSAMSENSSESLIEPTPSRHEYNFSKLLKIIGNSYQPTLLAFHEVDSYSGEG